MRMPAIECGDHALMRGVVRWGGEAMREGREQLELAWRG